ncbi:MAG: Stringent starvation protein B, partial [Alphaproteobacteria bacterium]
RYDTLAQEALRGVVRTVLKQVAKTGLPGEHHLYIAFDTNAPGVSISERLHEQYPEEMTIVLQYQFWDLEVASDHFEVKLSFNNIPERLKVPFAAIRAFYDPSVQFGLQFGAPGAANDAETEEVELPAIVNEDSTSAGSNPPGSEKSSAHHEPSAPEASAEEASGAKVVELDAFRKKS